MIRHPSLRKPEHSLLRVPCVEHEVDTLRRKPAQCADDAVERGTKLLLSTCCMATSVPVICMGMSRSICLETHILYRTSPSPCRGPFLAVPIWQSCLELRLRSFPVGYAPLRGVVLHSLRLAVLGVPVVWCISAIPIDSHQLLDYKIFLVWR